MEEMTTKDFYLNSRLFVANKEIKLSKKIIFR